MTKELMMIMALVTALVGGTIIMKLSQKSADAKKQHLKTHPEETSKLRSLMET